MKPNNMNISDGLEPIFAISRTSTQDKIMTSELQIQVTDTESTSYTCVFEDDLGRTEESVTTVYGATIEIDKGDEFYPKTNDNQVMCTFNSLASVNLSWQKELKTVTDTEEQTVALLDNTISLTSVKIDPGLDGEYECVAEAFGMELSATISITHMGVFISGPKSITIRAPATLECTAISKSAIKGIRWSVNGNRVQKNYESSKYIDNVMTSQLSVDPFEYADQYKSKSLDFECTAYTSLGKFKDYVDAEILACIVEPYELVALQSDWEITCTVVSELLPRYVRWISDSQTLYQFSDFALKSGQAEGRSLSGVSLRALPGEEGYVVEKGAYEYRQDGNDFFLRVSDSTYLDSGTYTCQLEYPDDSLSESTSAVQVRAIVSPQPTVLFKELASTVLTCILYNKERPQSVEWYHDGKTIRNIDDIISDNNVHTSTYTVKDPSLKEAGNYSCKFLYDDDKNPEYSINLQFAAVKLDSDQSIVLQSGDKLELFATVYSSYWDDTTVAWYKDGITVGYVDGFLITRLVQGKNDVFKLTMEEAGTRFSGMYQVKLITGIYPDDIVSEEISVTIIGSDTRTEPVLIDHDGGSIVLECQYDGVIEPTSVKWTFNDDIIDSSNWQVIPGEYLDGSQKSKVTISSMSPSDDGEYSCLFEVSGLSILASQYLITVRTISASHTGTQYITTPLWQTSISLQSMEPPASFIIYRGEVIVYPEYEEEVVSDTERRYVITLQYDKNKRGGRDDGIYYVEVIFRDGYTLKTDPIQIVARIALSLDTNVLNELVTESNPKSFKRSCDYSGADRPRSIAWTLGDNEVTEDDNHIVTNTIQTKTGDLNTYFLYETTMTVKSAVWEDSGTYHCNFHFETGDSAQATLPKVVIVKNTGMESKCITSFDGTIALKCAFESKESIADIKWFRWQLELDNNIYQNSNFEENKIESDLAITDGQESMDGRYYCTAIIDDETTLKSSVDARFASLSLVPSAASPYYSGSTLTIRCITNGKFLSHSILRNGIDTGDSSKHKFKVSDDTIGVYTCTGTVENTCETVQATALTESGDSEIEVIGAVPDILTHPSDVSVNEGESATMSCVAPFMDKASIRIAWYKVGKEGVKWGKTLKEDDTIKSILEFRIVTRSKDQGQYFCKVIYGKNAETNSNFATLSVVAFKDHPADTFGLIGGVASLTCAYYSMDKITFEIKSLDGSIDNAALEMKYENNDFGVLSTGEILFTNLDEENDDKSYFCQVSGTAIKSDEAKMHTIFFTKQPLDSWVVNGKVAAFTARTRQFNWGDSAKTVMWQKNVNNVWEDATDNSLYVVSEAKNYKNNEWYTIINIPNYSSSEANEWRVKLIFPSIDGLVGGELVSDSAKVNIAGVMEVLLSAPDHFEYSPFTLVCSITAKEQPSIKFYVDGIKQHGWEIETTFEDNVARASTTQALRSYHSGSVVKCQATVSYIKVEASETFPTVKQNCPLLSERENGEIKLTDVFDQEGNSIGKSARLACAGDDYIPTDLEKIEAECLFSTGQYDKELTSCSKFTPIDVSVFRVTESYPISFCGDDISKNKALEILNSADNTRCGWRNVEYSCYDDGECDFLPDETICQKNNNGFFISGAFKFNGDISQEAQDNDSSPFNIYKEDLKSETMQGHWSCYNPNRKRRALQTNRDDFLAKMNFESFSLSSETVSTSTTTQETTTKAIPTTSISTSETYTSYPYTPSEDDNLITNTADHFPPNIGNHDNVLETNVIILEETVPEIHMDFKPSWTTSTKFIVFLAGIAVALLLIFGIKKLRNNFDNGFKYRPISNNANP